MSFKCLRCGWCCANMSPINADYCPNLSYEGKKAVCAIYTGRPEQCQKEEMGHASICPVGMNTLRLAPTKALEYWRELEREEDIKACMTITAEGLKG